MRIGALSKSELQAVKAERDALARRVEAQHLALSFALRDLQRGDDDGAIDRLRAALAADDEAAK